MDQEDLASLSISEIAQQLAALAATLRELSETPVFDVPANDDAAACCTSTRITSSPSARSSLPAEIPDHVRFLDEAPPDGARAVGQANEMLVTCDLRHDLTGRLGF